MTNTATTDLNVNATAVVLIACIHCGLDADELQAMAEWNGITEDPICCEEAL